MATGHEMAMGLRAAYWAMHRRTDACFTGHKITANQFVLPALLAEEDGITQQQILAAFQPEQTEVLVEFLKRIAKELVQTDTTAPTATGDN